MEFAYVRINEAFDFYETGYLGCIKISPRKYVFFDGEDCYQAQVGTIRVSVSNVRAAHPWELELIKEAN